MKMSSNVGLGDEGTHERPVLFDVEILRRATLVPTLRTSIKIADVHVAPRLMAHVGRERAPALGADVAERKRRRVRVPGVNLAQRGAEIVERLFGAPGGRRRDGLEELVLLCRASVDEHAGRGAADRHRAE